MDYGWEEDITKEVARLGNDPGPREMLVLGPGERAWYVTRFANRCIEYLEAVASDSTALDDK